MKIVSKIVSRLFLLLCLFSVLFLMLGIGKIENENQYKISNNIYIEKVNVGHLSMKEAIEQVSSKHKLTPIDIIYGNKIWTITPQDIDLDFNIEQAVLTAYKYTKTQSTKVNLIRIMNLKFKDSYCINLYAKYNEVKLSNILYKICKEINIEEKDANFEVKDNLQTVTTQSSDGKEVDIVRLKEDIYNMINTKKIKDIYLLVKIVKPKINTTDVKSINTVLGQYSTSFNSNTSRGNNIYVASKSTSNILLMPGEEFSYNKATGARNWVNGYKTAKVIVGGKFVDGEGGGVCQVSTTIYNAALLSGLDITEVHNHTFPSRYAQKGRDAAVSYGYTDLKFINSFSHPIYIKNIVSNGVLTSRIYGCSEDREKLYIKVEQKYEKDKIIVKTYRIYFNEENSKIKEELVKENKYKIN